MQTDSIIVCCLNFKFGDTLNCYAGNDIFLLPELYSIHLITCIFNGSHRIFLFRNAFALSYRTRVWRKSFKKKKKVMIISMNIVFLFFYDADRFVAVDRFWSLFCYLSLFVATHTPNINCAHRSISILYDVVKPVSSSSFDFTRFSLT